MLKKKIIILSGNKYRGVLKITILEKSYIDLELTIHFLPKSDYLFFIKIGESIQRFDFNGEKLNKSLPYTAEIDNIQCAVVDYSPPYILLASSSKEALDTSFINAISNYMDRQYAEKGLFNSLANEYTTQKDTHIENTNNSKYKEQQYDKSNKCKEQQYDKNHTDNGLYADKKQYSNSSNASYQKYGHSDNPTQKDSNYPINKNYKSNNNITRDSKNTNNTTRDSKNPITCPNYGNTPPYPDSENPSRTRYKDKKAQTDPSNYTENKAYKDYNTLNAKPKDCISNEQRESAPFFNSIKDSIEEFFEKYPPYAPLIDIVPLSKWVKVDTEDTFYVVGLLYNTSGVTHICYGIPGEYTVKPTTEPLTEWLPLNPEEWEKQGFWMIYQNAETGQI